MENLKVRTINKETQSQWKINISEFSKKIKERWVKSGRRIGTFFKKYESWLDKEDLVFNITTNEDLILQEPRSTGRPTKPLEEVQYRSKKQKVEHLLSFGFEQVTFAATVALRDAGKRDAANLLKEISSASPSRSTNIKHVRNEKQNNSIRQFTKEEALAVFVDCRLTKQSYTNLRKSALGVGHTLYPSYNEIQKAKNDCSPVSDFIYISEVKAEIDLQALLNHTAQRLCLVQEQVLEQWLSSSEVSELTLVSKWGCDGSSGHSRYKQKFNDFLEADDEYLFTFSFVPIKLHPIDDTQTYIWQNERTSSTTLCRPIKFLFSKEKSDMVNSETLIIRNQILKLQPTKIHLSNGNRLINIRHQLLLTMVDGKVCNTLSGTKSSQTCYICKATPRNMNLEPNKTSIDIENYGFGLSTLHAWIRCFECLLHICYKLNLKSWQAKGTQAKAEIEERKAEIQKKFKLELGLIVDRPKPGFGSTNDGNTARKFFLKPQTSANITGLDETLITKFSVLLQALSSTYEINLDKFEKYADDTRKLYLSLYSWYYMPVTVHKILFHATDIIRHCIVPIGQLSEEAQEALNKNYRRFREHNTQKKSRIATNKDLLRMLLISSDPLITSYRSKTKKSSPKFSSEVLSLLKCPAIPASPPNYQPDYLSDDDEAIADDSDGSNF